MSLFRNSASLLEFKVDTLLFLKWYSPLEGTSKQPIIFIKVDFPDPDEPIILTKSPSLIERSILSNAKSLLSPITYSFEREFILIILK